MTIHIVDIEAVDTRYTKQWKEHLPKQLQRATNEKVEVVSADQMALDYDKSIKEAELQIEKLNS